MKKLILISLLLFPILTNAQTCNDYDIINVSALPEASETTLDKIYYYNGIFYETFKSFSSDSQFDILVDYAGETLVLNVNSDVHTYFDNYNLIGSDVVWSFGSYNPIKGTMNGSLMLIKFKNTNEFFKIYGFSNDNSHSNNLWYHYDKINDSIIFNIGSVPIYQYIPDNIYSKRYFTGIGFYNNSIDNYGADVFKRTFTLESMPVYDFVPCSSGVVEVQKDQDIFLFMSSYEVKQLKLFSNIDFTTFTTFQIILLTFIVNFVFISTIILFIYLAYRIILLLFRLIKAMVL